MSCLNFNAAQCGYKEKLFCSRYNENMTHSVSKIKWLLVDIKEIITTSKMILYKVKILATGKEQKSSLEK
jgi:hypothetical protein